MQVILLVKIFRKRLLTNIMILSDDSEKYSKASQKANNFRYLNND